MADLHIAGVRGQGLGSAATEHKRAVRFFWTVLAMASAASIAGNAMHAALNSTAVPPAVAAVVATAPPLVLCASTEGVSLLIRLRRHGFAAYWCALAMTTLLAACAFVLSFDALRDLAIRCGVRETLGWLWPVVVDVTIAQATMSLLALSRTIPIPASASGVSVGAECGSPPALGNTGLGLGEEQQDDLDTAHSGGEHARAAVAVVQAKRTRQSAEVVEQVLSRYAAGGKVGEIADEFGLHHSTVRRMVANAHHSRLSVSG
ncbi:MAG: DUF2637 domain-containing protein [Mycobacterium sp.]